VELAHVELTPPGGLSVTYAFEWIPGPLLLGMVLLPLVVPSFALIGLVVIALAAVAALVALAGAILAMPYLLVRSLRRRLAGGGPGLAPPGTEARGRAQRDT
jgi:hypothetical protein